MTVSWQRALVTGASSGIGRAMAQQLAAAGVDLVLVARDRARLEALVEEISRPARSIEVLAADLGTAEGCALVEARLAEGDIDLLVNNAGMGSGHAFLDASTDHEAALVSLNVMAVLRLTHAALVPMVAAGRGAVCNISSIAGYQPAPSAPTYAATKAFVTSLSESLHEQLRGTGVTVTAVCPGFTRSEFHERSVGSADGIAPDFMWMTADEVARQALAATEAGSAVAVPGLGYRAVAAFSDLLPRTARRRLSGLVGRVRDR